MRQGFPWRRVVATAAAGVTTMAVIAFVPSGASAADEPGVGTAIAQTIKADPKAGGLSLGITFGQALAGHQNAVAQAASQAGNFGVIGTTLAAQSCTGGDPTLPADKQPQALRIDSREANADKGKTETEYGGGFTKTVRANGTPYGEAVTTTAPFGIAGVMTVGGGTARTHSGLVNGVREAQGTVDLSGLDLAGVVKLSSLHWEATYRSGGDKKVTGRFTIGNATIAGSAVPTNDPSATLTQANAALAPLGLKLVPGSAHEEGGVLFVDPLSVAVVPNAQRDAVAGAVIQGIQPIRQGAFDALLKASCSFSSGITVFDVAIGSVTGAGEFALSFGGAQASSGALGQNNFSLGLGSYDMGGTSLGSSALGSSGSSGSSDAGAVGPTSFSGTAAPAAGGSRGSSPGGVAGTARPIASTFKGTRGGALAAVAGLTLALIAAMAEGDRRKMRRAQREIPST